MKMNRGELEVKAKEFDSKLKRHPMSSEELQKVLCDFVEELLQLKFMRSNCEHEWKYWCGSPENKTHKCSKCGFVG